MADNIDRLEIEVQAQAQRANAELDKLVNRLDKMSNSLSKINASGLKGLANGVQSLSTSMQNMSNVKTADFSRLAKNIEKLGNINQSGINATASALRTISTALTASTGLTSGASQITELANSISKLGYKSTSNAITNIPLMANALRGLMQTLSNSPRVSQNLISMTNSLANLASQGSKVNSAVRGINKNLKNYSSSVMSAKNNTVSFTRSLAGLYAKLWLVRRAAQFTWGSIEKSMDFNETVNLFQTSFKKIGVDTATDLGMEMGTAASEEFAKEFISGAQNFNSTLTESLGLDPEMMMKYQAIFAQMSHSMGLTAQSAMNVSDSLTMLGNDIASLWNIDTADAMEKLQSGLAGQIRPLRALGVDISQTSLELTAMKYGIEDNVKNMSQAAKVQLRWLTIMNQTEVAFGDMAKTINSPANQLRVLSQQWNNLSRSIGNIFIPIATTVLPYINAIVISIRRMTDALAIAMGYEIPDYSDSNIYTDVTGDIEGMEEGADGASESVNALKKSLASFDDLNILSKGSSIKGLNIDAGSGYASLDDAINKKTDSYLKKFNEEMAKMEGNIVKLGENLGPIKDGFKNLWKELKPFGENVGEGLKWLYDNVLIDLSKVTINETIPNFLYSLESALGLVNTVSDKFKNSKADDTIIGFLISLQKAKLKEISDWFKTIGDAFSELSSFIEKPNWSDLLSYVNKIFKVSSKISGLPDFSKIFSLTSDLLKDFDLDNWFSNKIEPWFKKDKWDSIFKGVGDSVGTWAGQIITWFGDIDPKFRLKGLEIINGIKSGWNINKEDFAIWLGKRSADISLWFGDLKPNFLKKGGDIIEGIKGGWNNSWESFASWLSLKPDRIAYSFGSLTGLFNAKGYQIANGIKSGWNEKWEDFRLWLNSLPLKIGNAIGSLYDIGKNLIQSFINGIKSISLPKLNVSIGTDTKSIFGKEINVPSLDVEWRASGGIVNDGQMFIARESGPEMVGRWGNKTAVANNDQIRGGIADAVKGALIEVLVPVIGQIGGSRNNQTIEVPLYLDGEELARGIYNGQQSYEGRMNPVKVGG